MKSSVSPQCLCSAREFRQIYTYISPPNGEIRFQFTSSRGYERHLLQCAICRHFISVHHMDTSVLYQGDYVSSNYKDEQGVRQAFDRINSLPPEKSDNVGRVQCVNGFAKTYWNRVDHQGRQPSIIDVGSGLCVFLYRMKEAGWDCTALDPDMRSARHAESNVGIKAICHDFVEYRGNETYDAVSFNKVLEHVQDPIKVLAKSQKLLKPDGFVYVEVPDGERAYAKEGPLREEFFIDHCHVFSMTSLSILATKSGFAVKSMERLQEPSAKYTLRAFLEKEPSS